MAMQVNELRGLIIAKNKTTKEIADELGIHVDTLNRKLRDGVMGSDEMEKLIKILDIEDPGYIFFGIESLKKIQY